MRLTAVLALLLLLASCGGGGGGGGGGTPAPPANQAPAFTSPATASVPENSTGAVYQAAATDPDGGALTFSIAGGADAARFSITAAGALSFVAPPDFEAPADADKNNVYLVQLRVSDGALAATLDLAVTVTDRAGEGFAVRRVGSGFAQPVYLAAVPGDRRVFVVERGGRILLLDPLGGAPTLFMTLAGAISTDGERGLLGMAAAPDYAASGLFYLFLTNPSGDIEIRRYARLNADQGNPASGATLLTIAHRQFNNHNGGWLGFGPDGLLYIATGDGGGAGDPQNNAQNPNSGLGKLLRMDVRQASPPAELIATGLRNPFRASFDGANLYIGDVGQNMMEEIDLLRPQDVVANFGWPFFEGVNPFRGAAPPGTVAPVAVYEAGSGPFQGRAVTGGYVYRGPALSLQGLYIFGDFVSGNIWSIPAAEFSQGTTLSTSRFTRRNADFAPDAGAFNNIVSFGEDSSRNLFIVDFDGEIFMIQAAQ